MHSVQTKVSEVKAAIETMVKAMKDGREAQTKASAGSDKRLNKAITGIGKSVATKSTAAAKATVTSNHLQPKEPPKLATTDFGNNHSDWKHRTHHAVKFWYQDVADLMTNKELSSLDIWK